MKDLVLFKANDAVTTSMIIAEGTGNQHRAISQLIRKYSNNLGHFGKLQFQHLKCRNAKTGRPTKVYFLSEEQATFLITLLNNNDIVVAFKEELVHQFYEMRKILTEKKTTAWIDSRSSGKGVRGKLVETIAEFIKYAISQGSDHAENYYGHFTNLANKASFIPAGKRDYASTLQLLACSIVENFMINVIRAGMAAGKYYKDIYKDCSKRVKEYMAISGIDEKLLLGCNQGG